MEAQYSCIDLRGGKDLSVEVQHIYIVLRGGKDLRVEVQHSCNALRGDKDLLMEVWSLYYPVGRKDLHVEVQRLL